MASRILCSDAISHVSFLDLFGPIAGAINPIMRSLLWRIGILCAHLHNLCIVSKSTRFDKSHFAVLMNPKIWLQIMYEFCLLYQTC